MNSDPGDLPPQLQSLEAALAALVPRAERLDRDRLMFEAGRESVLKSASRGRWAWPALSTAMTALAGARLVLLVHRPEPRVVERIVYVRTLIKKQGQDAKGGRSIERVATGQYL